MSALAWRAEEAFFNAWPAQRTLFLDGYLLRSAGGASRRINSLNPLPYAGDLDAALTEAGSVLAALERPLIVRAPSMAADLDDRLTERGFGASEGFTLTLRRSLHKETTAGPATLAPAPTKAWLEARAGFTRSDPGAKAAAEGAISLIAAPAMYAQAADESGIAAVGLGVLSRGLLLIEAVAARPDARGRGHGGAVTAALMAWARSCGADTAVLQVVADNTPARRLYSRLGFEGGFYTYHYRRRAAAPPRLRTQR